MALDGNHANVSQFKIGDYLYDYRDAQSLSELDQKVDKVEGMQLSEENFSTVLKTKLDEIESGAQVNIPPDDIMNSQSNNAVRNSTLYTEFNNVRSYVDQKTALATTSLPGTIVVGENLVMDPLTGKLSAVSAYELPVAGEVSDQDPQLGGVKIGNTLNIDSYGIINMNEATISSLGGVIVGDGLSIYSGILNFSALVRKDLGVITIVGTQWDANNKIVCRYKISEADGNIHDYYFVEFDNDYSGSSITSEYIVSRHWMEVDANTNDVYFNFVLYNPDGTHPTDEFHGYALFYKKIKPVTP